MRTMVVIAAIISLVLIFGTMDIYADDLALYLSFNEGKDDFANDHSGNGNDGILHGLNWTDSGKYGNAVEFKGVAGTWVEVPDSPSLDITDEVSILCWVYPT